AGMDHRRIAKAVRIEIVPRQQPARPGFHVALECAKASSTTLLRRVQIKKERENPLARVVALPISGVQVFVELPVARVVGRLPWFEVRGVDVEERGEAVLEAPQKGFEASAEPFLVRGLTHPERGQHVTIGAILLRLKRQTRAPERELQFVQDAAAFFLRQESVDENESVFAARDRRLSRSVARPMA